MKNKIGRKMRLKIDEPIGVPVSVIKIAKQAVDDQDKFERPPGLDAYVKPGRKTMSFIVDLLSAMLSKKKQNNLYSFSSPLPQGLSQCRNFSPRERPRVL